jgi:hypothetical protein
MFGRTASCAAIRDRISNETLMEKSAVLWNLTPCTLTVNGVSYDTEAGRHQAGGVRFL